MWMALGLIGVLVALIGFIGVIVPIRTLGMPTRGRAALILLLGFVLLSVGAVNDAPVVETSTPTSAEAAPPPAVQSQPAQAPKPAPEWRDIATWTGSGIKETESFTTTQREWRIVWLAKDEALAGAGILQIYVHDAQTDRLVSLAANKQGTGKDVSYVRAPPGRYYLKINSANLQWGVMAQEQR